MLGGTIRVVVRGNDFDPNSYILTIKTRGGFGEHDFQNFLSASRKGLYIYIYIYIYICMSTYVYIYVYSPYIALYRGDPGPEKLLHCIIVWGLLVVIIVCWEAQ